MFDVRGACVARRGLAIAGAVALQACTGAPSAMSRPVPIVVPHFAVDAPALARDLATKPNRTWQDATTDQMPMVREAMKVNRAKSYRAQAAGVTWNIPLAGPCSSAPAYAKVDPQNTTGPNPQPGDLMYAVTDGGKVLKIDPATMATTSVTLPYTFANSAVMVSGDNKRLYLLSTTGQFVILDAGTLATLWSAKISNAGFNGQAPFIDYGLNTSGGNTNFGSIEHVFAMSTDGSLYNVLVDIAHGPLAATVNAWTSSNGTDRTAGLPSWSTQASIPYGAAMTPGSTPVVWEGKAYVGTTTGMFYQVSVDPTAPTTAAVLQSWNLGQYTSAPAPNGMACSAPPALDFDASFNTSQVFAPCGDRVCWINLTSGQVYPSASLVVDKVPGSAAQYQGALANFPFTTSTSAYNDYDWDCVAKDNTYTPTRWGSGGATAIYGTPVSCATIKQDPIGGNMWAGQFVATPNGAVQGLTPAGSVVFTTQSSKPDVNEIAFDATGNCYAGQNATPLIAKFNNAGTLIGNVTYPGGKSAGWPQPDGAGNLWCTSFNTTFMAGGGNSVTKFDPTGAVLFTNALNNAFAIAVDSGNNAYVCTYANPSTLTKYNSAGTVQWTATLGRNASYVAVEPVTGNIWVPNYASNTISKVSPAGVVLGTYATPAGPWAVAFDNNGLPWVSCIGATNVNQMSLTGSILASYAIPGGGQPFELAFDRAGACWVSCSNGTYKIFPLGNLSDLFATDSFGSVGDGIDSLAFMKFRIPKGAYGGKPPVAASLTITAATTPVFGPTETLNLYDMNNTLGGSATLWQGWGQTINMDWNNRATKFTSAPIATLANITPLKDTSQTFNLGPHIPSDALNTTDPTYAWYSYAFNSVGKPLVNAAHWYSPLTAPAGSNPKLNVTVSTTPLPSTSGIRCMPLIDTQIMRVYVQSANCLFELSYNTAAPWEWYDPNKTFYNLTKAGRGGGPLSAGTYLYPRCNVMQNFYGDLFVVDQEASTGKIYANRFNRQFYSSPTTDHLAAWFDATPGTGTIGQAMLWDYDKGSVYFTTSNNQLIRGTLY